MKIDFYKYHGTGNDFIMIDNREMIFGSDTQETIPALCHRRFGIGADGVILLQDHLDHDFHMVYYNSDGRPSSMCGNGGRCIVKFAKDLGIVSDSCSFMAVDGIHEASVKEGNISLKMTDVQKIKQWQDDMWLLDTGSPHLIKFMADDQVIDVEAEGRKLRNHPDFGAEGVNVNFVWLTNDHELTVRTYERGVEAETWSCGTGVTAAAIAAGVIDHKGQYEVKTLGGNLKVSFNVGTTYTDVYLAGSAKYIFKGEIDI